MTERLKQTNQQKRIPEVSTSAGAVVASLTRMYFQLRQLTPLLAPFQRVFITSKSTI